jgi:hypothetical protein
MRGRRLRTATEDVLDLTSLVAGYLDPRGADFDCGRPWTR